MSDLGFKNLQAGSFNSHLSLLREPDGQHKNTSHAQSQGLETSAAGDGHADHPPRVHVTEEPGAPPTLLGPHNETVYFRDGSRKIDFVLAFDAEKNHRTDLRQTFQSHLLMEGLELEVEPAKYSFNGRTTFLKLHAPWEVLTRYAESLRLYMPMIENDIEIGKRSRSYLTRQQRNTKEHPIWVDWYHKWLKFLDWIWKQVDDGEVEEPTPYYMAPFNENKKRQFLIKDEATFFTDTQRIFIVWEILRRTSFDDNQATGNVGIYKLLNMKVYTAAFPLHDGPVDVDPLDLSVPVRVLNHTRMHLLVNWANPSRWYKFQPLHRLRDYLGDHVGLYFSFLGFYTSHLVVPSVVGLVVFLFGLTTRVSIDTPSKEVCYELGATIMCPTCDKTCDYWRLSGSCLYSRLTYIFDNYSTITLALITSAWANIIMVLWERHENTLRFQWDMDSYEDTEQVRPEFEIKAETFRLNQVTKKIEAYMKKAVRIRKTLVSFSVVILMLALACCIALGVITYRIAFTQIYASVDNQPLINEYAKLMAAASGSIINLITISILDVLYFALAQKLTAWENHRTETEHEHSLTFKLFLFQCVNYYSAIVYIAIFKGKMIGRPGQYSRIFGLRAEECDLAGCFIEFSIMCITVMVGKQIFALFYELAFYPYIISPVWMKCIHMDFTYKAVKAFCSDLIKTLRQRCIRKTKDPAVGSHQDDEGVTITQRLPDTRWEKDYVLESLPEYGLLYEYLELAIQYGFVTMFVVGFPLAPLFALINNVIEIQIDSYKVLVSRRRTYSVRSHGIGIWFWIFKVISKVSIIVNAIILAWTSDIINKFLYVIGHCDAEDVVSSPHLLHICRPMWDGQQIRNMREYIKNPGLALLGYMRYSLSKFDVTDWEAESRPDNNGTSLFGEAVQYCYYRDFRHPPDSEAKYHLTKEYWHVLAAKLAFVVCFEQAMILITSIFTLLIPVQSKSTEAQKQRAKFLANEAIHDLEKERSRQNLHQKKKAALNRLFFADDDEEVEEEEVFIEEV